MVACGTPDQTNLNPALILVEPLNLLRDGNIARSAFHQSDWSGLNDCNLGAVTVPQKTLSKLCSFVGRLSPLLAGGGV